MKPEAQFLTEMAIGRFVFNNGERREFISKESLDHLCVWLAKNTWRDVSTFTLFSAATCKKLQDKIESVVESLQHKFNYDDALMQQWMDRTFNVRTVGRCESVLDILKVLGDSAKREQVCGIVDFSKL